MNGKTKSPDHSRIGRGAKHTILNEVSHAGDQFSFFIPLVVFEAEFFSLKEVLHSPYVGDSGIEGIRVDFGVFSHRREQIYILVFEHL